MNTGTLAIVTQLDVANYRRFLLAQGKKPATAHHALDVLRSFFSWAPREGMVQSNPAVGAKGVLREKKDPQVAGPKKLGRPGQSDPAVRNTEGPDPDRPADPLRPAG